MKKLILAVFLLSGMVFGQGARFDQQAIGSKGPIANVIVTACSPTATGIPCSPTVPTFTDITLGTACGAGLAVTLPGQSSCQGTSDSSGNYGFWLSPGAYRYSLSGPGITGKLYDITIQAGISVPVSTVNGGTGVSGTAVFPTSGTVETGTGTTNSIAKFTNGAAGVQGNSALTDNGTSVSSTEPFSLTPSFQKFTSSGTFTIPTGVIAVKVTIIGGGGAGGGASVSNTGAGGGSGGIAIKFLAGLTPGNTLTVTVGTGGAGASNATGGNGVASSVASGTQTISTITANPGTGGQASTAPGPGGGAAISTGGDINGGGSPASFVTVASTFGGAGGSTMFGGAGGFTAGSSAGLSAVANTGSGGGGAGVGATNAGGSGAAGIVLFEWTQ
jgi:hypothetical protein